MSTVKFTKEHGEWFYTIRPGFERSAPLTEEILFKAFGVTGLYEVEVSIPDGKGGTYKVTINNGFKSVKIETPNMYPMEVTEFVVKLPPQEPALSFKDIPGTLSMDWVKWKMKKDNLFETEAIHIGTRKVFATLDPVNEPGDIYVDRQVEVYWTVRKELKK